MLALFWYFLKGCIFVALNMKNNVLNIVAVLVSEENIGRDSL